MSEFQKPLLIFIVGSTATGKTEFSLLAHRQIESKLKVPCEIVNFDSVQVFQGIEIGTAKPTKEQRDQAPHHLLDFVPKGQGYTAGEYRRDALKVLRERTAAGVKVFLLIGGSGFYAQALEKGMFEIEAVPPHVRNQLDEELKTFGLGILYEELKRRDPEYAESIAPQDSYRILRGLEVVRAQNKTLTQIRREFSLQPSELEQNFYIRKIGLRAERDQLRSRVTKRTDKMLAESWVDEVKSLRAEGFSAWAPLQSVGYKEIQLFLDGQLQESELREKIILSTMQLAKRQVTWFKRDQNIRWCRSEIGFQEAMKILDSDLLGEID